MPPVHSVKSGRSKKAKVLIWDTAARTVDKLRAQASYLEKVYMTSLLHS